MSNRGWYTYKYVHFGRLRWSTVLVFMVWYVSGLVRFNYQRDGQACRCTTSGIWIHALLNIVLSEINNRIDVTRVVWVVT